MLLITYLILLFLLSGYLMSEFTHFWFSENPADVMEFNRIRDKFKRKVILLLKDPQTQLVANFQR